LPTCVFDFCFCLFRVIWIFAKVIWVFFFFHEFVFWKSTMAIWYALTRNLLPFGCLICVFFFFFSCVISWKSTMAIWCALSLTCDWFLLDVSLLFECFFDF
jgi:hypothetical protein